MGLDKPAPLTPAERALVKRELLFRHRWKWYLIALVVRPTHVHVIPRPLLALPGQCFSLPDILHGLKKGTSRIINQGRGRRGTLWETENYDHLIRDEAELAATFRYLLENAAEEAPDGDPYAYDGFWCESESLPEGLAPPAGPAVPARPVHPRIADDEFLPRQRKLPHWELAGATYHVVISLKGYRPEEQAWPGAAVDGPRRVP